jgi:hypothetical protein
MVVASVVVMTLRLRVSIEMVAASGVHRMEWCSISGKIGAPIESMTGTNGSHAGVQTVQGQGQGRPVSGENRGVAEIGTTTVTGMNGTGDVTTAVTVPVTDCTSCGYPNAECPIPLIGRFWFLARSRRDG